MLQSNVSHVLQHISNGTEQEHLNTLKNKQRSEMKDMFCTVGDQMLVQVTTSTHQTQTPLKLKL